MRWVGGVFLTMAACAASKTINEETERTDEVATAQEAAEFVPGEAVVRLADGADPPLWVRSSTCTVAVWADARTVLLRCLPKDADPAQTKQLIKELSALPGVRTAEPNMIRRRID